jgi:hypothetical protein
MFIAYPVVGQIPSNSTPTTAGKQSTFVDRVLTFLGFGASSGTLKGPGDEVSSGDLWVAVLNSGSKRALTSGGGYRSPIFLPGTSDILALRGSDVVRVPLAGGEGTRLYSIASITKLVGAGVDNLSEVLILLQSESGSHPRVALLAVSSGAVTAVPYDPASPQELKMVESLEGWSRTYGDKHVYVDKVTKSAMSGPVEWVDVIYAAGDAKPMNISNCDGSNCGQPSLSSDGHQLVFVKASQE